MFIARSEAAFAASVTVALITTTLALRAAEPANETAIRGTIALPNQGERRATYANLARIAFQQAIDSALGRQSGKLIKVELQDEDGFLVYNVEVVTPDNKHYEIKVDAGNGSVLRVDGAVRSESESENEAEAD
jgi:peptidase YpeB-like protein